MKGGVWLEKFVPDYWKQVPFHWLAQIVNSSSVFIDLDVNQQSHPKEYNYQ